MNEERYTDIENSADYRSFSFTSNGRHGDLIKVVRFDKLRSRPNTYNLALGTRIANNSVDYESITNNGDRNKLLATVAIIVYIFLDEHPGQDVYITGSDHRRTVLYQRAINYAYADLIRDFNIFGEPGEGNGEFEIYDGSKSYFGFLVAKK